MLKLVLPGLAVCTLCACGYGAPRQLPPDRPAWSTTFDAGTSRLAYGFPDSDAVALSLECKPHSGRVTVSGPLAPGASKLILVSGVARREIRGTPEPDPEAGVDVVAAAAEARDTTLAAFARTGRLARVDPSGSTDLPASGAERALVQAFLERCAG
jgi:hypothetical protein